MLRNLAEETLLMAPRRLPGRHPGGSQDSQEAPRGSQEAPRGSQRLTGGSQEAPRRHPGGTQEAPRRHPEAPRAPRRLQEVLEPRIDTPLS